MKRLFAILMLLVFSAQFVPFLLGEKASVKACSVTDCEEEKSPEKMEKKAGGKKELKDFTAAGVTVSINGTPEFLYRHSSHSLSNVPPSDILTPPPNKG